MAKNGKRRDHPRPAQRESVKPSVIPVTQQSVGPPANQERHGLFAKLSDSLNRIPVWKEFGPWLKYASGFVVGAATATQLGEFLMAVAFLLACLICCLVQISVWTTASRYQRAKKIFLGALSLFLLGLGSLDVVRIKGNKPWSNLSVKNDRQEQVASTSAQPIVPAPTVYEPFYLFDSIHTSLQELGDARKKEVLLDIVYFGAYDSGSVIWIGSINTFYVLKDKTKTWESFGASTVQHGRTEKEEPTWYSDECNSARLGTPKDKLPPYGGVAKLWDQDLRERTNNVRWLGGRLWHCEHHDAIYLQEFANGFIVGPFRTTSSSWGSGQVFAFINNGRWDTDQPRQVYLAPPCPDITHEKVPCR